MSAEFGVDRDPVSERLERWIRERPELEKLMWQDPVFVAASLTPDYTAGIEEEVLEFFSQHPAVQSLPADRKELLGWTFSEKTSVPLDIVRLALALDGQGKANGGAIITRLSDVKSQTVRWLWPDRIPLGKVTVFDGDPGLGKSVISLDFTARVSSVRPMPDGSSGDVEQAGVVLLSAEDDAADTIVPRLKAADADLSRIAILSGVQESGSIRLPTLADLEEIRRTVEQVGAKLVVIDPLMAYLPSKTDSYRDQDVRRSLAPLAAFAAEMGVAVLVIRHLNKTGGGNPLYRGGGSIGIIGAARSGLLVAKDPDDPDGKRHVLVSTKSNLSAPPPSLAYHLEEALSGVVRVKWEGESHHTAASLLAQQSEGDDRSALDEGRDFLRELLAKGPVPAKEVQRAAHECGISEVTLRRAKTSLGVKAQKTGQPGGEEQKWVWALPPKQPEGGKDSLPVDPGKQEHSPPKMIKNAEDDHKKTMITFEGDDHLRAQESDPRDGGQEVPPAWEKEI